MSPNASTPADATLANLETGVGTPGVEAWVTAHAWLVA